jgi:Domain of unknown function (DUF1772)
MLQVSFWPGGHCQRCRDRLIIRDLSAKRHHARRQRSLDDAILRSNLSDQSPEPHKSMIEPLMILTASVLGLFAGSLFTEAFLLVPYFRSLKSSEFYRLHHDFGPRLYRYYAPLTIIATILPLVSAAGITLVDPSKSSLSWFAAALGLAIMSTYFLYFRRANLSFAEKRLSEAELGLELTRWSGVHNFRTALAIGAFVVSILAASRVVGPAISIP